VWAHSLSHQMVLQSNKEGSRLVSGKGPAHLSLLSR
jgi:hypothetical protein